MDTNANNDIIIEQNEDIATIIFNRPSNLNALNIDLLRKFRACMKQARAGSAKALRIIGKGDATCAGVDLELAQQEYETGGVDTFENLFEKVISELGDFPRPTVVGAKGAMVGAGLCLAIESDFLVVGEETTLSLPEVQYGLSSTVIVDSLVDHVGLRIAKELIYLGEPIDPERAYSLGLANRLVSDEEVDDEALKLINTLVNYEEAYEEGIIDETIEAFANTRR